MGPKNKFRLVLIIFIVVLVATLATLYIYRTAADISNRFIERAEYFAMAFADRASFYLSQDKQEDLDILAKTTVLGSVLYIQIVKDGQIVLEEGALAMDLAIEHPPAQLVVARHRAADGQPYVDIIQALPTLNLNIEGGQKLNSYVRIGTSLLPLKLEIRNEILIVSGVSLGFIMVSLLAIFYLTKMLFERPKPLEPAVEASVSAELAEQVLSSPATSTAALKLGDLLLDDAAKKVSLKGEPVELSPKEYELLKLLASKPGKVFSNEEILEKIWTGREFASQQDVKQYIYFLRRKLEEDPENPKIIITVRGFGYKLET